MSNNIYLVILLGMVYSPAIFAEKWSDNSISARYGIDFSEAGVGKDISKTILNFTHISGDSFGSNFFTVDNIMSNGKDPSVNSSKGAQEVYGFYQRTLSLSSISLLDLKGKKLNDLSLFARFDFGAKNTEFASRPRKIYLGVMHPILKIENGFWNLGISGYKETNHNGITGEDINFNTTWAINSVWDIPYGPGNFGGFINVVGPKGKDGFGTNTKPETLIRVSYLFNIAQTDIKIGAMYDYWRNMYGNSEKLDSTHGAKGNTPMVIAQYKF